MGWWIGGRLIWSLQTFSNISFVCILHCSVHSVPHSKLGLLCGVRFGEIKLECNPPRLILEIIFKFLRIDIHSANCINTFAATDNYSGVII